MTPKEAIEYLNIMRFSTEDDSVGEIKKEVCDMAIEALKKLQDYETQWLDDLKNPLEPLKLSSALNSEIFKLKYRRDNKPKEINILDYTVIAALQDCLKRYAKAIDWSEEE